MGGCKGETEGAVEGRVEGIGAGLGGREALGPRCHLNTKQQAFREDGRVGLEDGEEIEFCCACAFGKFFWKAARA